MSDLFFFEVMKSERVQIREICDKYNPTGIGESKG